MVPLIYAKDISIGYGKVKLINNLTFKLFSGEIVIAWGSNGSGKTTLASSLIGEVEVREGVISTVKSYGFIPDNPVLWESLTLAENIGIVSELYKVEPDRYLYNELSLKKYDNVLANRLSLGTRKKLNLILGTLHSPKMIIIDELFNSMDWESIEIVKDWIRTYIDGGGGIFLTTNRLDIRDAFNSRVIEL